MQLLTHPVRFGDTALGPVLHSATFFDLVAVALEKLASTLDYPFTEILEHGGIPYAPVDVRGDISSYPTHGETIVVDGAPLDIGTRSFSFDYTFKRASDGMEYGHVHATHVTVGSDGNAENLPQSVWDGLTNLREHDSTGDVSDCPEIAAIDPDAAAFSRIFQIQTPHIEAADLGYFEEYFRFISIALEEFLTERESPIETLCGPSAHLQPFRWSFSFKDTVPHGAELTVLGSVQPSTDPLVIQYRLNGHDRTHITGAVEYDCYTLDGKLFHAEIDAFPSDG